MGDWKLDHLFLYMGIIFFVSSGGKSMKFGLIGEVLGHSLSPKIHELLFQKEGWSNTYDLIEIPKEKFSSQLCQVLQEYDGLNVTIPYKLDVIPFLDEVSEEARTIGAVNTIAKIHGKLKGFNTDYIGFKRTVGKIKAHVKEKPVAVLGHGGASRAVIQSLFDEGALYITVVSRHPDRIPEDFLSFVKRRKVHIVDYVTFEKQSSEYLLVNTTPVGMYPKVGVSPISEVKARSFEKVIDIIYNPEETKLLQNASKADKENGMYMLVMQAMAAEEIWMGRKVEENVVMEIVKDMAASH